MNVTTPMDRFEAIQANRECPLGLTASEVEQIVGSEGLAAFDAWMSGQTCSICEGKRYDHDLKQEFPDECAGKAHGVVTYSWDMERYLLGLPVID